LQNDKIPAHLPILFHYYRQNPNFIEQFSDEYKLLEYVDNIDCAKGILLGLRQCSPFQTPDFPSVKTPPGILLCAIPGYSK